MITDFLDTWAARLGARTGAIAYESLPNHDHVPRANTYVFTDIERLTWSQRQWVADVADQLAAAEDSPRILNHPTAAWGRYRLLRELFERKRNPYRAYRVLETTSPRRFPVFLRFGDDHNGPVSPLLTTKREVERAAARLCARGRSLRQLLMVEFEDTSDDHGTFRKYSMHVSGDQLIPGNLQFSTDWVVKYTDRTTPEQVAESAAARASRAHDVPLREIADLAGIQWGRFDYALADGRICVWELNTNPTLLLTPDRYSPSVRADRAELAERLTAGIDRLAGAEVSDRAPLPISCGGLRKPSRQKRALKRAGRAALARSRVLGPAAALAPRQVLNLARRVQKPARPAHE